eukprot:scaffold1016_cov258-Pinguiococcus_pyrenoidosus.AAC.15
MASAPSSRHRVVLLTFRPDDALEIVLSKLQSGSQDPRADQDHQNAEAEAAGARLASPRLPWHLLSAVLGQQRSPFLARSGHPSPSEAAGNARAQARAGDGERQQQPRQEEESGHENDHVEGLSDARKGQAGLLGTRAPILSRVDLHPGQTHGLVRRSPTERP